MAVSQPSPTLRLTQCLSQLWSLDWLWRFLLRAMAGRHGRESSYGGCGSGDYHEPRHPDLGNKQFAFPRGASLR